MNTRMIVILVALFATSAIGCALCCGGAMYFAFQGFNTSVSPEVDKIFAAIDGETVSQSYDADTSPEFRQAVTREQFVDLGKTIKKRLGPLKSKSMRQFNVRQMNADQFADVSYSATFEKGPGTISTRFKRNGERWLLVHLNVDSPVFKQNLASVVCPHCGAPHASGANFCPKCGKAVTENDEPPHSEPALTEK